MEPKSTTTDTVCSRSNLTFSKQGQDQEIRQVYKQSDKEQAEYSESDGQAGRVRTQGSQVIVIEQSRDSLAKTHKTIWQRTRESGQV